MSQSKNKLIISIDGGGIRGVLPLLILEHIENMLKQRNLITDLNSKIDLVAGTSTGVIISAGLVARRNEQPIFSVANLLRTYRIKGPKLFNLSLDAKKNSWQLGKLLRAKFEKLKISDLGSKFFFISFDLKENRPFFFSQNNREIDDLSLEIALQACSSIPGLFSPVLVGNHQLIDGFIFAKNPTKLAYQYAQENLDSQGLTILSFGTGRLQGEMHDDIEKEGEEVHQKMLHESQTNKKLNYFRFQPDILTANPQMDAAEPKNILALIDDGRKYIRDNESLFERLIQEWEDNC